MTRLLVSASTGLFVFVIILTMTALAVRSGLMADDAVMLWAGAITAGDGGMFSTLVDRRRVEGVARNIEQVFKMIDEFRDA